MFFICWYLLNFPWNLIKNTSRGSTTELFLVCKSHNIWWENQANDDKKEVKNCLLLQLTFFLWHFNAGVFWTNSTYVAGREFGGIHGWLENWQRTTLTGVSLKRLKLSQHFTIKLLKYLFKYASVYFWRLPFSINYQSVWSLDPKPPIICSFHKSIMCRYCSSALQRPIAGNEQNKTFGSGHFIPRTHTLQIKWVSTLQILCTEKS